MSLTTLIHRLIFIAFVLTCSQTLAQHHKMDNDIAIHDPIVAITPPSITNTVAYFHIMNHSNADIELVSATSNIAERTEIHEHTIKGEVMKMQKIDSLVIPAKSTINFEPGGYHIMFLNVKQAISEGQEIQFYLTFSNKQTIKVKAKGKEPRGSKGKKHHHHHGNY